jgi:hypothetical protein
MSSIAALPDGVPVAALVDRCDVNTCTLRAQDLSPYVSVQLLSSVMLLCCTLLSRRFDQQPAAPAPAGAACERKAAPRAATLR